MYTILLLSAKQSRENQCNEASRLMKNASEELSVIYPLCNAEKSLCNLNSLHLPPKNHYTVHSVLLIIRVQGFWLFSTFWDIAPIPETLRAQECGNWQKKFNFIHGLRKFWQKPENGFFGLIPNFNFRNPVWRIFNIFSACFIYGIFNTHTKFRSLSQKLKSQGND